MLVVFLLLCLKLFEMVVWRRYRFCLARSPGCLNLHLFKNGHQCVLLTHAQLLLMSPAYLDLSYDFSGLFYTQMYSQLPCHFLCISGTCRSDHGRCQSCSRLWSMCSFIPAVKCDLNMAAHYFYISPLFSGPSSPSCTPHSASPCYGTVRDLLNAVK